MADTEETPDAALARRRAYMNEYMRARRATWRAAGLCIKCGKPRAAGGKLSFTVRSMFGAAGAAISEGFGATAGRAGATFSRAFVVRADGKAG